MAGISDKPLLGWFYKQNDYTKASLIISSYFIAFLALLVMYVLIAISIQFYNSTLLAIFLAFAMLIVCFVFFKLFYKEPSKLVKKTIFVLALISLSILISLTVPFFITLPFFMAVFILISSPFYGFYGLYRAAKEDKPLLVPVIVAIISFSLAFVFFATVFMILFPTPHRFVRSPVYLMANKIEDAKSRPTVPVQGGKINFTKDNRTITTESIVSVSGVGLEKEQICLSPGQFMGQ
ncbi:MAG: hypothetical protein N3F05_03125, partial [Candidatus Diapherotrites archaeon]|nr:hypothetical protein [Candidatus Diapherotrites archaeon]